MPEQVIPRDYQEYAVDILFQYFMSHVGNPVVAMPTGTGKSVVIARFCQRALTGAPMTVILALTHVKELIEQNAAKIMQVWSNAPVGVYSAGLKRKDTMRPITFGGVKSVFNAISQFGRVDILIIDECHLLSPNGETTYQQIITYLKALNPHLKIIGFTATHYRQGQGLLINPPGLADNPSALFTHIAVDMTTPEWWRWFVAKGYLVQPTSRATDVRYQLANVGQSSGDYNLTQLNKTVDQTDLNHKVAQETLRLGVGRRAMLAFCAGVEHADHMAEIFTSYGWPVMAVHSKLEPEERDRRIDLFKRGQIWGVTNNNVLTTGFDHPPIDYIPQLRPTSSTSLYVQMIGRGTRPAEGKSSCLCPDFAGNIERLGPVNDPMIPKRKGDKVGEAPVRICEHCGVYNHASARVCVFCGEPFTFRTKITLKTSEAEIFAGEQPVIQQFNVMRIFFHDHTSKSGAKMIRVSYHCGSKSFTEFLNFEGKPYTLHVSHQFWRRIVDDILPADNAEALERLRTSTLNVPDQISVHVNKQYPEVVGYVYK